MATIDIYKQYFSAACTFNGVERRGVVVWLIAESDCGNIRYEVGMSFFPHQNEEDFAISYDASASKELINTAGRRSKKRDRHCIGQLRETADQIAAELNGSICWDKPLRDAQYG